MTTTLTKNVSAFNGGTYTYRCVVTENSYSVANNTSNVTITFSIKGPWAPSFYEWNTHYGIVVDGTVEKADDSYPYISTSYVQLLTWTGDITHQTDGSKEIGIGVYLYHNSEASYLPNPCYSDAPLTMGFVKLTTIPRASSITSVANVTLGNTCSVKWTPASTSFKYKLKFVLGDWSHTTDDISPNQISAYTYTGYTIPKDLELLKNIPNSTTEKMTATLYTYNSSGAQIGSESSKTFTVTVPNTVVPTISADNITFNPYDINNQNILVQGKNRLEIIVSECTPGTGSSIKSYTFSGPGISTTTTNTRVTSSSAISTSGNLTYTVKVTDNRGRTSSSSKTIYCHPLSIPYFKSFSAYRSNSDGDVKEDGSCINCKYTLGYSSVGDTNDVTVKIYYKKSSASSYSSVTVLEDDKTTTSGDKILSSIDTESTYVIYATITDNYNNSSYSSNIITVFGPSRVLNITSDGTSVAIGKMADQKPDGYEGMFECRWPAQFDDAVTVPDNGGPNLNGYSVGTLGINTPLNEGDDLNDYITPGVFSSNSGDISATIINAPYKDSGFKLTVEYLGTKWHIRQTVAVRTTKGLYYTRYGYYENEQWNWNPWRVFLNDYNCGDYTVTPSNCGNYALTPSNYTDYTCQKPVVLFNDSSGSAGIVTLDNSSSNYNYIEIFFTDNNGVGYSSTKIVEPNGKIASLSLIDPGGLPEYTYIRRTNYTISGSQIAPDVNKAGYVRIDSNVVGASDFGTNYIRIVKVLGYK